jgi:CRP/FNR family transcriptional regulator, cyclic AMP receptor protein
MRLGRTSERAQALRNIPLFRELDGSDLEQVARMSYGVTRQPGEVIIQEGDVGTDMYLLVDGTARVERNGQVIGDVGRNSVIGEMALIDTNRRSASIIATTECELLAVPYDRFWTFVDRVPSVQRKLLVTLSRRVRELEQAVTA